MLYKLVRGSPDTLRHSVISLMPEGTLAPSVRQAGATVQSLGMNPQLPGPRTLLQLVWQLRRERPDIIQTWLYHADVFGLAATKLARLPTPVLWNIRCSERHSKMADIGGPILARWSAMPAAVIVNSYAGKQVHERHGYAPRRWEVIPNGFDTSVFAPNLETRQRVRAELGFSERDLLIAHVARYHRLKDQPTLLRAARRVIERVPTAHFIMIGRGVTWDNPELREFNTPALRGRVRMLGERSDIPALLMGADVGVSSSCSEGFANAIGEAMSTGLPCVVTDVGDSGVIVGDTGLIVPPRDPERLADGLLSVLRMSSQERALLGRNARERIEREYSLRVVVDRYATLYEELAAQGRAAAQSDNTRH